MASLYSFGVEVTLENYIRQQVKANNGAKTRLHTKKLQDILDKVNIKYKKTATKNELLDLIYGLHEDWGKVAEVLKIGAKVNQYTEYDLIQFQNMSDEDMKTLLLEHPKGKRV